MHVLSYIATFYAGLFCGILALSFWGNAHAEREEEQ